jgi:hypothetical protein
MFNRYKSITKALLVTLKKIIQSVTFYNKPFFVSCCFIKTYKISLNFVTFCNAWGITILNVYYKQLITFCNVVTPITLSSIFLSNHNKQQKEQLFIV